MKLTKKQLKSIITGMANINCLEKNDIKELINILTLPQLQKFFNFLRQNSKNQPELKICIDEELWEDEDLS